MITLTYPWPEASWPCLRSDVRGLVNLAERDNAVAHLGYQAEGITGYVYPP
jgi:hypothetical protein